jgi:dipeptidyl aminopeptidase/acylaminoacyl peptidase
MTRARENGTPTTLLKSPAIDARPSLSPDGRWLAYLSAESGRAEVYVRPFPLVDSGTWQLSTGGVAGKTPRWTPSGRTLVFGDASGLVEVTVETSPAFKASLPQRVLTWPDGVTSDFDISRDGTKFLVVKDVGDAAPGQLNVVLNWVEELKRLVPTN